VSSLFALSVDKDVCCLVYVKSLVQIGSNSACSKGHQQRRTAD